MEKVVISKKEYLRLKKQSKAYQKLVSRVFESAISDTVEDVVTDFKKPAYIPRDFWKI